MSKVKLGNTDLTFEPIVFGGNVFGWTIDEKQSFAILDGFVDRGFSLIDTANQYSYWVPGNSGGESEQIIGNWLKKSGKRDQVLIATKVGGTKKDTPTPNTAKDYIIKEVEFSLKRLQIDTIDLYQTHFDNESIPVEETLEAYQQLIKEGKVKWIGASNLSPTRLEESLEKSKLLHLPRYESLQPEYNLYHRQKYEQQYEKIVQDNNLGVITYYSLASGFLTGKYRNLDDLSKSVRGGSVKEMLDDRGLRILKALDEVSDQHQTSVSSIALAWIIARPSITAPIVSVTKLQQLEDFTAATHIQLTVQDIEKLNVASTL
ncbi:aldo/keto reductase [Sphingobacterium sp. SG20118]|uniref:aldo/keto reductase n=1 Tax=Sphingobacterium TaxID=28453 RepID=UPI0004F63055|nr:MULTISPECIES: aldo/keto reductase [Sphingobacterium]AIM36405.1 alcohol dehydrogenase [Sphingobacterium sp. ML3W]MDH5827453.1 aldo/keto reductase [Sphingobacterium faecium]